MNTLFHAICLIFFWCFFTGQIVAIIGGKLQEKSEAAWLADLTNATVFDNKAFTSCSKIFRKQL